MAAEPKFFLKEQLNQSDQYLFCFNWSKWLWSCRNQRLGDQ